MIILSHRGYWKDDKEKNTIEAFERSFSFGFGTETDIREYKGELVISHDIAKEPCLTVKKFFEIYNNYDKSLPLALNIKADGLQEELLRLLKNYKIDNYFVFDMSVPDGLLYIKKGFCTFTRHSEYEPIPPYYTEADGIWIDQFFENWISKETIKKHLDNNKQICIVSPELHNRDYTAEWKKYKQIEKELRISNIMLCTDYPEKAREYFGD